MLAVVRTVIKCMTKAKNSSSELHKHNNNLMSKMVILNCYY